MKKIWITTTLFFIVIFVVWYAVIQIGQKHIRPEAAPQPAQYNPIRPGTQHTQYWSMGGKSIMLLGGSVEDNLFQSQNVDAHLELLKSVGGNYVRNTMSSRDEGNVWPFAKNDAGLYNLNTWNAEYWNRFDRFLSSCADKAIIVQIELWATFDYYRENWTVNPFNPKNNVNYSAQRVHLPTEVNTHPTLTENNFFWSIPSQESNLRLLEFQQKYIDKLLSYSLHYDNILYCMDNETSVTAEWGKFWSSYIKKVARERGKEIFTTEMWDPWNLGHVAHRETFDHPETYDFVDISQNNHNSGDVHWNNGLSQIQRLQHNNMLRPLNNVKVYGNDGGRHKTTQNAIESFMRNVLFGAASSRFHRPPSGQGLNDIAQHVIRSTRDYIDQADFFNAVPANHLLYDREENEAYCRAIEGQEYAIYFPAGGQVTLKTAVESGEIYVKWCDVLTSNWAASTALSIQSYKATVIAPGNKNSLAVLKYTLEQ